jgi:hypothetical protein
MGQTRKQSQMLPIQSCRRKDICGHREICHPALCFGVVFLWLQVIPPKLVSAKKQQGKIPCCKVGFEVIFHCGVEAREMKRKKQKQN